MQMGANLVPLVSETNSALLYATLFATCLLKSYCVRGQAYSAPACVPAFSTPQHLRSRWRGRSSFEHAVLQPRSETYRALALESVQERMCALVQILNWGRAAFGTNTSEPKYSANNPVVDRSRTLPPIVLSPSDEELESEAAATRIAQQWGRRSSASRSGGVISRRGRPVARGGAPRSGGERADSAAAQDSASSGEDGDASSGSNSDGDSSSDVDRGELEDDSQNGAAPRGYGLNGPTRPSGGDGARRAGTGAGLFDPEVPQEPNREPDGGSMSDGDAPAGPSARRNRR